jgi:DTW domain-containing protein YfiP
VLFPREDAPELDPAEAPPPGQRFGYVVLDGTWHQCSRMSRRVPVVMGMPCVALPAGPSSIWTVRTQHDERGVSTFEAALRVLELCESAEIVAPVRDAFALVTARLLWLKGKLPSPEPPAEWRG